MKRSVKRFAVILMEVALLGTSGIANASVYLNGTDYGSVVTEGPNYLGEVGWSSLRHAIADARQGDVIQINDNNSYQVRGQTAMNYAGVTVRSADGYRATISAIDGGTNGTFELGAAGITFQNLSINGTQYNPGGGTYAFQFINPVAGQYVATGFTVQNVYFSNLRSVIDAGTSNVTGMTFVNNTVTNTNEALGAGRDWGGNGMNFGGGVVITGNTFINNGVGTNNWQNLPNNNAQAALWIGANSGSLLIDNNTFRDYNGRYAIYSNANLSANPITLGTNDFGTGIGGSGAAYELYDLQGGGHAVGLMNSGSAVGVSAVPEPATIIVWSLLGLTAVGFGCWRRKRAA